MPFDYDAPIYYPPMKPFHPHSRQLRLPPQPVRLLQHVQGYPIPGGLFAGHQAVHPGGVGIPPLLERVFLLGGQSFCLKADKLKEILRYIRERPLRGGIHVRLHPQRGG